MKTKTPEQVLHAYDNIIVNDKCYYQMKYAVNAMTEYAAIQTKEKDERIRELEGACKEAQRYLMDLIAYNHISDDICQSTNGIIDKLHNLTHDARKQH